MTSITRWQAARASEGLANNLKERPCLPRATVSPWLEAASGWLEASSAWLEAAFAFFPASAWLEATFAFFPCCIPSAEAARFPGGFSSSGVMSVPSMSCNLTPNHSHWGPECAAVSPSWL